VPLSLLPSCPAAVSALFARPAPISRHHLFLAKARAAWSPPPPPPPPPPSLLDANFPTPYLFHSLIVLLSLSQPFFWRRRRRRLLFGHCKSPLQTSPTPPSSPEAALPSAPELCIPQRQRQTQLRPLPALTSAEIQLYAWRQHRGHVGVRSC
jgi:hypothetical protein